MKKLTEKEMHQSQRGYFAGHLYNKMIENEDIFVLTGDLGWAMWDKIRDDFPNRFYNLGASEQSLLDIAVGLAYDGKIPVCYSISTFLTYRPFETIRTYIDHEKLNVKLIASGRDKDYKHDGISHDATDVGEILKPLKNIRTLWPHDKNQMKGLVHQIISEDYPFFVSLRR